MGLQRGGRLDLSTAELSRRLTDPDLTVVDGRPRPANGWRLHGEAGGGHVSGAVAFPSAWRRSVDDAEVERLLHKKDIVPPGGRAGEPNDVSAVKSR